MLVLKYRRFQDVCCVLYLNNTSFILVFPSSIRFLIMLLNVCIYLFKPRGKDESDSNDADFELISSDESDDIEIEEIEEEGDSDMDEMLDDAEEIFVWDDKRRTYKKTKHKTPVHRVKKTDFVGDVYTATEKWY